MTIPDHVDILADLASGGAGQLAIQRGDRVRPRQRGLDLRQRGHPAPRLRPQPHGGRRGDSAMAEIANPPEGQAYWRVEEEFCNAIRGQERITRTPFDVACTTWSSPKP